MDAIGQRALARRNRRDAVEEVPAAPREENPVESDTEESDILEQRDQVPLRIYISRARSRGRCPAVENPAAIDPGMWLSMVKPSHLADLEVESMKEFILDYKRYSVVLPLLRPLSCRLGIEVGKYTRE